MNGWWCNEQMGPGIGGTNTKRMSQPKSKSFQAFIFSCFAVLTSAQAQPVLDSSNYGPVPGIAYMAHYGGQQTMPAMGNNVTWNYADAVFAQEGTPVTYGTPGSNAPQNSTVAEMNDSALYTYFYNLDATGFYLAGRWCEPANASCNEPDMQMPFPFAMGSTSTTSFSCPGHEVGLPFAEGGLVQCEGVGFGSLNLPYGSVDSVLLVHRTEYLQHSTTDPHSPVQLDYTYYVEQFIFAKPGIRVPLLRLELKYWDENSDGIIDTTYTSCLMGEYTVGMHELLFPPPAALTFPNPNAGQFTVAFSVPLTANSFYSVYDAVGKLLFQRPLAKGQESEEMDLSRFGSGTYLVRITSKDGVCNERVVVQ